MFVIKRLDTNEIITLKEAKKLPLSKDKYFIFKEYYKYKVWSFFIDLHNKRIEKFIERHNKKREKLLKKK